VQHAALGLFVSSLPRRPIGLAKRERATQNGTSFLAREPSMTNRTDLQDLMTVRDWLRYGVTRFEEAALTYGHGTDNAVDEAAFLILAYLRLPIEDAAPWLDCRLTLPERRGLLDLIEARISTRKPAPYLVRRAYIGAHRFHVDERVIVPRSFIGELLVRDQLAQFLPDPGGVQAILELCTGSGCLAILAALQFPAADVVASDISSDALDVAQINVTAYGLNDKVSLVQSDLFETLPAGARYDLIIANPPYVTQAAVDAFPPEYRAEPQLAHLGGEDGLDLVTRIINDASRFLTDKGLLVVELGQAREALEALRPDLPFLWLDTETSEGEVFALTAAELADFPAKSSKKASPKRGSLS
jgi:ribosomal protein L3 glutamine methyltransferase